MSDDAKVLSEFRGAVRLFPLPEMVFFPHVLQGLHIFEPRYRQMTADALADDGLITLVMLKSGAEQAYLDEPEMESIACLGRITQHERLPDGKYNLRLKGLCRVRLTEEIRTDKLYRSALAELIPDMVPSDVPLLSSLRRRLAEAVLPRFEPTGPAFQHLVGMFAGETPLGPLVDMLAFALPLEAQLKQMLLEEPHVNARVEILTAALDVPVPEAMFQQPKRKFPPDFSIN
jgi:uncharacterized protein